MSEAFEKMPGSVPVGDTPAKLWVPTVERRSFRFDLDGYTERVIAEYVSFTDHHVVFHGKDEEGDSVIIRAVLAHRLDNLIERVLRESDE